MEVSSINENSSSSTEEEFLVYVDFEGNLLSNDLDDSNMDIHIIGIDSENPVIEINGKIFEGNYNNLNNFFKFHNIISCFLGSYDFSVGTNVFLEIDDNPSPLDPLYDLCPKEMYKLHTKTNKVLKMRRMLIESKQVNETENKEESIDELKEKLKIDMSYQDALNLFLPPGTSPPRQIDEEYGSINGSRSKDASTSGKNTKNSDKMDIDNNGGSDETADEDERNDPDYLPTEDI